MRFLRLLALFLLASDAMAAGSILMGSWDTNGDGAAEKVFNARAWSSCSISARRSA